MEGVRCHGLLLRCLTSFSIIIRINGVDIRDDQIRNPRNSKKALQIAYCMRHQPQNGDVLRVQSACCQIDHLGGGGNSNFSTAPSTKIAASAKNRSQCVSRRILFSENASALSTLTSRVTDIDWRRVGILQNFLRSTLGRCSQCRHHPNRAAEGSEFFEKSTASNTWDEMGS